MKNHSSEELSKLACDLKILLLDVDGVLTDGGIVLIGTDLEAKRFDVRDGMGVRMLRTSGLIVGIVTSRTSDVVQRRANELDIEELFQGIKEKPLVLNSIYEKYGINPSQVAFVGDDLQDISLLKQVGIPIAVQDAAPDVKHCSSYVTKAFGGQGAVREIAEWLLELRGDTERVYQSITGLESVPKS